MKGFKRLSCGLAMALCITLAGCGTDMAQLTEAEEELIVAYASGVVAKANKSQPQGMTYLFEEEADTEDIQEESQETSPQDTQSSDGNNGTVSQDTEANEERNTATLTEVLNMPSIIAEYQGYQVSDSYVEGDYFALNAQGENTYLILQIELTNMSEEAAECDVLGRNLTCGVHINGAPPVEAMPTIMLKDFLTYMESIDADTAEDTVLIFEVPKEAVSDIQTLTLDVEADGTLYNVGLE